MKINHLVVNVDAYIQEDKERIADIESIGLPYMPKWGKGTKGFKVSNLWIGQEYFEFVRIKAKDGGGWVQEWTTKYLAGHRGLIGFALEVENIEDTYHKLRSLSVDVTPPEPLRFRWFFNLLTRTMPWRNAYLPGFTGVPFQFFLQQMNDEKSRKFMEQYMVPNSQDQGITGISEVNIHGELTEDDTRIIFALFDDCEQRDGTIIIRLGAQCIRFVNAVDYKVEVLLACSNPLYAGKEIDVHNLHIRNM
ncbi:VOC family protein [Paenibacillus sp. GCM10012306]|uniref:VOC family protein n=1 Tax=Paenibacillus sp. GCM10012306 TaxID=3317342 RepID=UPI0036080830